MAKTLAMLAAAHAFMQVININAKCHVFCAFWVAKWQLGLTPPLPYNPLKNKLSKCMKNSPAPCSLHSRLPNPSLGTR